MSKQVSIIFREFTQDDYNQFGATENGLLVGEFEMNDSNYVVVVDEFQIQVFDEDFEYSVGRRNDVRDAARYLTALLNQLGGVEELENHGWHRVH